ncbi:vasopressin V1a receptor-like [Acanthaster planci]|uniref:Vasopressin V1a receptor-like n=1 Tax=Acanthaster planci TaxID=133434 RepID=A0A8B7ZVL2_ACAPL|nr:vasopressin V1a receptor-like [Acanthaster planci]
MDAFNQTDICSGQADLDIRNAADEISLFRSPLESWCLIVGQPIVFVIGALGNLSFLFTLNRIPQMRTTTNLHLANLAVSDFIYVSVISLYGVRVYLSTPVSGTILASSWVECAAFILLVDIPYFVSNTIVTLVAFERYYAICHPLKQNASSPRCHLALLVGGWVLSIGFAFSVCLRYSKLIVLCVLWPETEEFTPLSRIVTFCSSGEPWANLYSQGLYSAIWMGGLLTNSILYFKIIRRLGRRGVGQSLSRTVSVRRSVARMLIINSIVFFVCQAPYSIIFSSLNLIKAAWGTVVFDPRQVTELWPLATLMGVLNGAVNPIIYGAANSRYRKAFLQAFGCATAPKKRPVKKTTSTISSNLQIGIPGNLAFLFTLFRVRCMRTTTNFYLANLAVADLLYIAIFSVYNTETFLQSPIAYTSFASSWQVCLVIALTLDVPYFASNSMITLVAFERFYAICHPLKNLISRSRKRTASVVAISWTASIFLAATISSRLSTHRVACVLWPSGDEFSSLPDTVNFCLAGRPWVKILTQSLYFGFWLLGLLTNTVMYYKIIRRLSHRPIPTASVPQTRHHLNAKVVRNQVARLLIVNSVVYFVLQSPRVVVFNLIGLIQAASGVTVLQPGKITDLWPIALFLTLLNSSVNPIIYNATSQQYRQAFLQAFACRKEAKENAPTGAIGKTEASSRSVSTTRLSENLK